MICFRQIVTGKTRASENQYSFIWKSSIRIWLFHILSSLIRPDDSDIKGQNLIYEANVQKQKSVPQKLNSSKILSSQRDSDSVSCKNYSNTLTNILILKVQWIFSSNCHRINKYSISIFKNLSSFPTVAAMTGSSVSNGLQNGNSANGTAATVNGCWTVGLINR